MIVRIFLTISLGMICLFSYSQNENTFREEFTLKLRVNSTQFYEQKVIRIPFFVKENILQIFPGEKLLIEVEINQNEIISMKVVKDNLNLEKTIAVEFTQEVKERKSESMILMIKNPFDKNLEYKARMFIVGHDKWIDTHVLPVRSRLTGFEMWTDVIISLVLSNWKLK